MWLSSYVEVHHLRFSFLNAVIRVNCFAGWKISGRRRHCSLKFSNPPLQACTDSFFFLSHSAGDKLQRATDKRRTMVVASGTNSFAKEMAIRKRIINIFNKREEDFPSLKEYNDYLEEVEDMTCNLIEGIDVPAIEAKIAKYERENYDQIMNDRARKAEEFAAALAASKGPALIETEAAAVNQSSQAGFSGAAQGQYAPVVAGGSFQPRPMGMATQPLPLGGSLDMPLDDEEMMRLRAERGGRAGGWSPELSRKRALEEAFGSLWI
ncbi:hypothetical protein Nepgr_025127 [Nepenthes gracilis]|uniref:MAT1 centre domain-containing protein n=1 Tax=Nepenthes gracilis TaxID=150966 RepID=A0AAD3T6B8_NEPGR|nr:hypothetical protein Nepgr_025127 [Nepenthes gracilis]